MPPLGFKPAIAVSERSQTHTLDREGTGISLWYTRTLAILCQ